MRFNFSTTADCGEMQGGSDAERMLAGPMLNSKLVASRQMKQMSAAREVVNYLISTDGRAHNGPAARILAAASAWAYSDLNTFATVLGAFGLSGEFVAVNVTNEPNLIDTTAYMFLSGAKDDKLGRLAILAFRGTTPSKTITLVDRRQHPDGAARRGRPRPRRLPARRHRAHAPSSRPCCLHARRQREQQAEAEKTGDQYPESAFEQTGNQRVFGLRARGARRRRIREERR